MRSNLNKCLSGVFSTNCSDNEEDQNWGILSPLFLLQFCTCIYFLCSCFVVAMAALKEWVSDRLHELLGLSDGYTAEFLIGIAKKSNSEDAFVKKLRETSALNINDAVLSFATELWIKVPHRRNEQYVASREKEKAALLQEQRNKSYRIISDDDTEDISSLSHRRVSKKEKGRGKKEKEKGSSKRKRFLRKEKASAWESESEEEQAEITKKTKVDSDSDEWDRLVYYH